MTMRQYEDLPPSVRRRLILRALVRPLLSTTVLLVLYYSLPLGNRLTGPTVIALLLGLVVVAALLTWQIVNIRTAQYPRLRAIESLSVSLPLFILVFAAAYFAVARNNPASFSEALTRTDALYFTVTVFATVGFGDITPVAQGTRVMVMVQMLGDLVLAGIVAHVIVAAVKTNLRSREPGTEPD